MIRGCGADSNHSIYHSELHCLRNQSYAHYCQVFQRNWFEYKRFRKKCLYLILSFTKFIIIIINISAERAYPKARTPQPNGPALPTSSGFLRPPTPCMGSSTFRLLIWDE